MVVICYLERDHDKVLKFHISNSPYFEKSGSLFYEHRPFISVASESFKIK